MLWSLALLVITIKDFFFLNLHLMLCKCRTKNSLNISVNIIVKGKKKDYLLARIIILERKESTLVISCLVYI